MIWVFFVCEEVDYLVVGVGVLVVWFEKSD